MSKNQKKLWNRNSTFYAVQLDFLNIHILLHLLQCQGVTSQFPYWLVLGDWSKQPKLDYMRYSACVLHQDTFLVYALERMTKNELLE